VGNVGFMIGDTTIGIFCYVTDVEWLQIIIIII
jgi:hypothetical protein